MAKTNNLLHLITLTIKQLPDDVRYFALDRCVFISVGRISKGLILPGRIGVHLLEPVMNY